MKSILPDVLDVNGFWFTCYLDHTMGDRRSGFGSARNVEMAILQASPGHMAHLTKRIAPVLGAIGHLLPVQAVSACCMLVTACGRQARSMTFIVKLEKTGNWNWIVFCGSVQTGEVDTVSAVRTYCVYLWPVSVRLAHGHIE